MVQTLADATMHSEDALPCQLKLTTNGLLDIRVEDNVLVE